jgi:hypothetical protein
MLTYAIDQRLRVVELLGPSPTSAEEFVRVMRRALSDPEFREGFGFLRDRSGMSPPPESYVHDTVRLLLQIPAPTSESVCYAVVASDTREFARMLSVRKAAHGSWLDLQVFDTRAEALAWIRHVCEPAKDPTPA